MKIALLGDIAMFGAYSVTTNSGLLEKLSEVSDYLLGFDCVVGNLETPFSEKKKTNGAKSAYICADVNNIDVLKKLHLSAVCLANNHVFDYGEEGYSCTKDILENAGIKQFGTDGNSFTFKKDGNRLFFSGFCCYTSNPLQMSEVYGKHGVNCYNLLTVSKLLKEKNDAGYLNIVAVHAGIEHVNYPHVDHIKAARQLSEQAPYVYYGHHPHVIQGVENVNGSVIAYSLGNFCFDDVYTSKSDKPLVELSENNRHGLILELEIENNQIVNYKETVIHIGNDGIIHILKEIPNDIDDYNNALENACDDSNYMLSRNMIINERLSDRKSKRNLSWYLKRLRPRYVEIILNARKNNKAYNRNVRQFIKK